ncbi:hypothetical protein AC1031_002562 [Aphanomyces cochlioides]|nr:hypothetical protein AC1031_002562 [Aphanomyces cochlioides]
MEDGGRTFYYNLIDQLREGHYKGSGTLTLDFAPTALVKDFCEAVLKKNSSLFGNLSVRCLLVFNGDHFLDYGTSLQEIGTDETSPLTVRVFDPMLNNLEAIQTSNFKTISIEETNQESIFNELRYYRERGILIQQRNLEYCNEILDRIDKFAEMMAPTPFLCVEGSSGMGKTQLAFALHGRRPYFYWLSSSLASTYQEIYENFSAISRRFNHFVDLDNPTSKEEEEILNTGSDTYSRDELWTYGFIRSLLNYCSSQEAIEPKMIHFAKKISLNVIKCSRRGVLNVMDDMVAKKKVLPFFILDEMNVDDTKRRNVAAFQRNVFCACGLVVILMGLMRGFQI